MDEILQRSKEELNLGGDSRNGCEMFRSQVLGLISVWGCGMRKREISRMTAWTNGWIDVISEVGNTRDRIVLASGVCTELMNLIF